MSAILKVDSNGSKPGEVTSLTIDQIGAFDGSALWSLQKQKLYEVGNFLGGGAAGTVYEAIHSQTQQHFALKILNPLGFKLMAPATLRRCTVVSRGQSYNDTQSPMITIDKINLWWLINGTGSAQHYVAAYHSIRHNELRELSLAQCMIIWGDEMRDYVTSEDDNVQSPEEWVEAVIGTDGQKIYAPKVPKKFAEYLKKRSRILREIRNMKKISDHPNVITFMDVLELTQESKSTIFVVLELANGGELFDRIKIDYGTREDTAKMFFKQLVDGVFHCHMQGVCHRDLKPENLLLMDVQGQGTLLKIADFGFSATFMSELVDGPPNNDTSLSPHTVFTHLSQQSDDAKGSNGSDLNVGSASPLRTLTSVVGSPFYVAPEVLQARGYSGPKADVWSLGVILYAMLAGNLPFGEDLGGCKRFRYFCQWIRDASAKGARFWDDESLDYPAWLFPPKFSVAAKGLIVAMLHPDPLSRISVEDALRHPWCPTNTIARPSSSDDILSMSMHSVSGDREDTDKIYRLEGTVTIKDSSKNSGASNASDNSMDIGDADESTFTMEDSPTANSSSYNKRTNSSVSDQSTKSGGSVVASQFEQMSISQQQQQQQVRAGGMAMALAQSQPANNMSPQLTSSAQQQLLHLQQQQQQLLAGNPQLLQQHLEQQKQQLQLLQAQQAQNQQQLQEFQHQHQHQFQMLGQGQQQKRPSFVGDEPPPALPAFMVPSANDAAPDLLNPEHDSYEREEHLSPEPLPPGAVPIPGVVYPDNSVVASGERQLPQFHNAVKKSTRFLTTVPAHEVLDKVAQVLEECMNQQKQTPIGQIAHVEMHPASYYLQVKGSDRLNAPTLFALQLYQYTPSQGSASLSQHSPFVGSLGAAGSLGAMNSGTGEQFVVEFIRGQLEIFAFKRFYSWLRQEVVELVKRDAHFKYLDQAGSPMVDSGTMSRFSNMFGTPDNSSSFGNSSNKFQSSSNSGFGFNSGMP